MIQLRKNVLCWTIVDNRSERNRKVPKTKNTHPFDMNLFKVSKGNTRLIKLNFMAPFYGWGSTASRLEPLRGGSLLFTTKFPEISGTHFTDLGRMKD